MIAPKTADFTLLDIGTLELARQMTITDSRFYLDIGPWEFIEKAWMGPKAKQKAPNLSAFIASGNKVRLEMRQREKFNVCLRYFVGCAPKY